MRKARSQAGGEGKVDQNKSASLRAREDDAADVKRFYSQKEAAQLLALSESQVRSWTKTGLVKSAGKARGHLLFDFKNLIALRMVKRLIDQGISARRVALCVKELKKRFPELDEPLCEVRLLVQNGRIILCKDDMKFTPDGQLLIHFNEASAALVPLSGDGVEDLFFQALACEEEGKREEAKKKYESILALEPDHTDAIVNLGNLLHLSGSFPAAENWYRKALKVHPAHVEANYNLANLLEERGERIKAIGFYERALAENPDFADAHFNLARLLERHGALEGARQHWRSYLRLDPSSEWARYARTRLSRLKG